MEPGLINLLIAVQAVFNVGIILLVVVSYHYLFEKIREEGQVDAVLKVEEVKKLKSDMEGLVDRIGKGAGDSVERLEKSLELADKRIKELKSIASDAEGRTEDMRRLLDRSSAQSMGQLRPPVSSLATNGQGQSQGHGTGSPFERVYLLADEMDDIAEIARRCQLSQGEVEMILNLRTR